MFKDFSNIKVGDKVIATKSGFGSSYRMVANVTKVNKASFVCEGNKTNITFNFNGSERGASGWVHWYCEEYTKEKAEEIYNEHRKAYLVYKLKDFNYNEASLELLEKLYALIEKKNEEN